MTFETFKRIGNYDLHQLTIDEPWCFNGGVGVRKYRVTVEVIEEPAEVIAERVRNLWRKCNNHHHWMALKAVAESVGVELDHDERGIDAKR